LVRDRYLADAGHVIDTFYLHKVTLPATLFSIVSNAHPATLFLATRINDTTHITRSKVGVCPPNANLWQLFHPEANGVQPETTTNGGRRPSCHSDRGATMALLFPPGQCDFGSSLGAVFSTNGWIHC